MENWWGLIIFAFVILCGWFGLSQLSKPYDVTTEEFERRAKEGPGLISAGLVGLQKFLDPAAEKAAVVQEDLKQGRYDGEQGSGEPPDAGSAYDENEQTGLTDNEDQNSEREQSDA
jgi:hypothetical protein